MKLLGAVAHYTPWSPAELEALRVVYSDGGIESAEVALPGRSRASIYHQAARMGLTRRRRWTVEEDSRLRRLWDAETPLAQIAARLERTATATYWRAQQLGLPLGCPDGWEYLTTAAERTGFDTTTLRRILRWAGVSIHRSLSAPGRRRRGVAGIRCDRHVVAPGEVDVAIEQWMETEPLERAAERLGVCRQTLARRLEAVGIGRQARRKAHWRVSPEQIAAALAARPVRRRAA